MLSEVWLIYLFINNSFSENLKMSQQSDNEYANDEMKQVTIQGSLNDTIWSISARTIHIYEGEHTIVYSLCD